MMHVICLLLTFKWYVIAKSLTIDVYNNWESIPMVEQLNYIIDDYEFDELRKDYDQFYPHTLTGMLHAHEEFADPEVTTVFFETCDNDDDGIVSFGEYCMCRGEHDVYGEPSTLNEWTIKSEYVIADFEDLMMRNGNGNDSNEVSFKLDEEGIIID